MTEYLRKIVIVCVLIVLPRLAGALEPKEVLVVANSASQESVALAEHYVKARGIDKGNILLIQTGTGYEITRTDYEMTILDPIRKRLAAPKGDTIKCICLMRGVPVRIKGVYTKEESDARLTLYRTVCEKNQYALTLNLMMLRTVGTTFPRPKTDDLFPPGKLFDPITEEPAKPLKTPQDIHKAINDLLSEKTKTLQQIKEPEKLKIACRQIMAVILDSYGIKGLLAFASANKTLSDKELADLSEKLKAADKLDNKNHANKRTIDELRAHLEQTEKINGRVASGTLAWQAANFPQLDSSVASVDSELSLLTKDAYELAGPLNNHMHWKAIAQKQLLASRAAAASQPASATSQPASNSEPKIYMTARLDGPTNADAIRMIDDAIEVEKTGLAGTFYIDAGGKTPEYDANLKTLRDAISIASNMKVVYDDKPTLFPEGACPDAALYVGWYSLRKYIPAFTWNKGAVGMHIASFEAVDLRNPNTEQWCAKMIQNGVAATIGAVEEPLLLAFPMPQEFFPLLMTGKLTLAECYWRTIPSASWMMIVVGDPLYNPFKAAPAFKAEKLPPVMWQ